jgi:hypothetical protein
MNTPFELDFHRLFLGGPVLSAGKLMGVSQAGKYILSSPVQKGRKYRGVSWCKLFQKSRENPIAPAAPVFYNRSLTIWLESYPEWQRVWAL